MHWSGDGSYYPIIDADDGDYSFKITADDVVIRKFEVHDAGSDGGSPGDAGVVVDGADDVTLDKIISKGNTKGIWLDDADGAKIYTVTITCDEHHTGLYIYASDNIVVDGGYYYCTDNYGIHSLYLSLIHI